jgi:FkbM family methyltransferase
MRENVDIIDVPIALAKHYAVRLAKRGPRPGSDKIKVDKNLVLFDFKGKRVKFAFDSEKMLDYIRYGIEEVFERGAYSSADVVGRQVIDIGANVGDSAIYFALMGAGHVYAYEPVPRIYKNLRENVEINRLASKITCFNAAVGCAGGEMFVDEGSEYAGELKSSKRGVRIRSVSLSEINKMTKAKDAVLKIDCEGGEYKLILDADTEDLRRYSSMVIEYHRGYKNIVKRLREAGFRVRYKRPIYAKESGNENPDLMMGMVYASREKEI